VIDVPLASSHSTQSIHGFPAHKALFLPNLFRVEPFIG
jgi:hypothetical protein